MTWDWRAYVLRRGAYVDVAQTDGIIAQVDKLQKGQYVPTGTPLFSLIGINPTRPTRPFAVIRYAASRASSTLSTSETWMPMMH